MASKKTDNSAAVQYAQALLSLANDKGVAEPVGHELADLLRVVEQTRELQVFLSNPAVSPKERWRVIEHALRGKVSPLVLNTLGVMNSKNRLGLLAAMAGEYQSRLDEQLGKIEVDVTVARELDAAALGEVQRRVSQAIKKEAVLHQKVDASIIGGIILKVRDKLIDGSVRAQLDRVKRQLMAAAPR